jgi:hypothetical protein
MIDKFITFKEPHPVEDTLAFKGGMIFRTHVVMTDGRHLLISDAKHGSGFAEIDETLVFECDESGTVTDWTEIEGCRLARTEEIINRLNAS